MSRRVASYVSYLIAASLTIGGAYLIWGLTTAGWVAFVLGILTFLVRGIESVG